MGLYDGLNISAHERGGGITNRFSGSAAPLNADVNRDPQSFDCERSAFRLERQEIRAFARIACRGERHDLAELQIPCNNLATRLEKPTEGGMPIINNDEAREIPFREGYRVQMLAGADHGITCSVNVSVIEPGAGAPLHVHPDVDEVIIVLEGTLDVQLGADRRQVGPNHTLVIPGGIPHAFTAVGPTSARAIGFLPKLNVIASTTYLEGQPPYSRRA
jgi:quercetin dioxygenase-like cupin family protein